MPISIFALFFYHSSCFCMLSLFLLDVTFPSHDFTSAICYIVSTSTVAAFWLHPYSTLPILMIAPTSSTSPLLFTLVGCALKSLTVITPQQFWDIYSHWVAKKKTGTPSLVYYHLQTQSILFHCPFLLPLLLFSISAHCLFSLL